MKKKFTKILGVGLTLALLTSLLLTAAPVSALIQPAVTVTPATISKLADYTVLTTLAKDLPDAGGKIVIAFPAGTDLTSLVAADITLDATSGIGSAALTAQAVTIIAKSPDAVKGPTLTITMPDIAAPETKIGVGAMLQVTIGGTHVLNPSTVGSYTLAVSTTLADGTIIEAAVTSTAYSIGAPTISTLPGIVKVYNPSDILMEQTTGSTAFALAIAAAGTGYTIKVGPGTYTENVVDFVYDSLTIVSTESAATTIIKGAWTVNKASMTLDGLTINGVMTVTGNLATVKNCAIGKLTSAGAEDLLTFTLGAAGTGSVTGCTFDTTLGATVDNAIVVTTAGLTVSSCSFILDSGDTAVATAIAVTVKDCPSITGSGGIGVAATAGISTISGSTFDGLATAFNITGTAELTIKQNTIKNSTGDAINIAGAAAKATITGNDINTTAATKYAVVLDANVLADANVFVMFNNMTGNTLNVKNAHVTLTLNATHNWWGVATGPVSTSISGLVNTSGYLSGAVTPGAGAIAIGAASLTAKTTAGVDVTTNATAGNEPAVIGASQYVANPAPGAPPYPALANGYFDVYMSDAGDASSVTVKLYGAVTADTEAYVYSALGGTWIKCTTQSVNSFGGYVYVTVTSTTVPSIVDLAGLPFAIVAKPATAVLATAPDIIAPETGDDTVSLTPIFAWGAVAGADGYYFQLADNANFVTPMVKLDGDLGRLVVTAYAYVGELPYSTAYYWRVQAVSGTVAAGNLLESAWSTGVFITMAEPAEELPPVVVQEQPPVIIEPIVEVITPAATEITPSWIYVIIGVGAVLVIALLVLIVRTRRVA